MMVLGVFFKNNSKYFVYSKKILNFAPNSIFKREGNSPKCKRALMEPSISRLKGFTRS